MVKTATRPSSERDFPSSPAVPPVHVLYATNAVTGRVYVANTVSDRAMKAILTILGEHDEVKYKLDAYDRVMAYQDPDPANPYQLPENVERSARQFASGNTQFVERPAPPQTAIVAPENVDGGVQAPARHKHGGGVSPGKTTSSAPNDEVRGRLAPLGRVESLHLAKINGFYKESYEALDNGRVKMTVSNGLRTKIKRGEVVKWS